MLENILKKTCSGCNTLKPETSFSKRKASKDGLNARCKTCDLIKTSAWKEKNHARKLANDKKYYYDNKQQVDKTVKLKHESIDPAVYMIRNLINGKTYIGTSKAPYVRIKQHLSYHDLDIEFCSSYELAEDIHVYSKRAFIFGVIEYTTKENKHSCEQKWIKYYQPQYNIRCKSNWVA